MTATQWKIYNEIKNANVISSKELCEKVGFEVDVDSEKRNLSRKSLYLYKEIEKINDDPLVDKPILWDTKSNYWLARSQEDVEKFVNRIYRKAALTKLSKMWNLLRKGQRDGQGKLFTNDLRDINESPYAKRFVESFVSDLEIEEEIKSLIAENEQIDYDENKYLNGRYEKKERNLKRIEELKKWQKQYD